MAAGTIAAVHASGGTTHPRQTDRIALSDRAMGLRQALGTFAIARECGATGVEVDLGRLGARPEMTNRLLEPAGRVQFLDAAAACGVSICSLALGAFADQSFATHPKAVDYAGDLLDLLDQMKVRVGVLPVGAGDDLADDATRDAYAVRLKTLAPRAQAAGVVLAVDAAVPADVLRRLLDAVASPAVQACVTAGPSFEPAAAFDLLGPDRVAQIRVRHGGREANALRQRIDNARWTGWLVIERPAQSAGDVIDDCGVAVNQVRSEFFPTFT